MPYWGHCCLQLCCEIFTCFLLYCCSSQSGWPTLAPRSYSPLWLQCLRGCWDLFGGASRLPSHPWLCPSSGHFLGAGCLLSSILPGQTCPWSLLERRRCLLDESSASAVPLHCSSQTCFGPLENKTTKWFRQSETLGIFTEFKLTFKGEFKTV